jgi:hypothetical protein
MIRYCNFVAVLVCFSFFVLGCGGGPKVKKGEDPFKSRADTQTPEKKDSYMKPGNPPGQGAPGKSPGPGKPSDK